MVDSIDSIYPNCSIVESVLVAASPHDLLHSMFDHRRAKTTATLLRSLSVECGVWVMRLTLNFLADPIAVKCECSDVGQLRGAATFSTHSRLEVSQLGHCCQRRSQSRKSMIFLARKTRPVASTSNHPILADDNAIWPSRRRVFFVQGQWDITTWVLRNPRHRRIKSE